MMNSLFLRTLYDKRWFIVGWAMSIGFMALLMVAMFPALRDSMSELSNSMPQELRGLMGDTDSFTKLDSYLSSQLYDIRIPLFLMIMGVVLANGLIIAFEEKGALRTVLAGAKSRIRWFLETWSAGVVIFFVTLLFTGVVTFASIESINESIDPLLLIKLALVSLSFAICVFTLVFATGAASGSRALTMTVGIGLIVIGFILEAGRAVDWLEPFQKFSLLHYYDASKLTTDGIDALHQMVIGGLTIGAFIVGILSFRRRDIS